MISILRFIGRQFLKNRGHSRFVSRILLLVTFLRVIRGLGSRTEVINLARGETLKLTVEKSGTNKI